MGAQRILGMRHGAQGALQGDLADLGGTDGRVLEKLRLTPAAALGSCRYKLQDGDAERLVRLCQEHGVDTWVYIGGNDSADTSRQLQEAATAHKFDLRVIGVPKTIDNDLPGTDHCPGYGSAARFVAAITRETAQDTRAMRHTDPIRIIEVMGRHAGWLPGASWLARQEPGDAPHLVYLPERPRPSDEIVQEAKEVYQQYGWCVVVLCENQPEPSGKVLGAGDRPRWVDSFGHAYYESPAQYLTQRLMQELRVRARYDKPGTIQRNALAYVSATDRAEAELVGRAAIKLAHAGKTGVMVTLQRTAPYEITTSEVSLKVVANEQRRLPDAYINAAANGLTSDFVEYARPLIGEPLPELARLF
jgi:ATP-dependent phosphofructokinase / diphosphate-dependent phosphofructokinase